MNDLQLRRDAQILADQGYTQANIVAEMMKLYPYAQVTYKRVIRAKIDKTHMTSMVGNRRKAPNNRKNTQTIYKKHLKTWVEKEAPTFQFNHEIHHVKRFNTFDKNYFDNEMDLNEKEQCWQSSLHTIKKEIDSRVPLHDKIFELPPNWNTNPKFNPEIKRQIEKVSKLAKLPPTGLFEKDSYDCPGNYVIVNKDYVYIGETKNFSNRLKHHGRVLKEFYKETQIMKDDDEETPKGRRKNYQFVHTGLCKSDSLCYIYRTHIFEKNNPERRRKIEEETIHLLFKKGLKLLNVDHNPSTNWHWAEFFLSGKGKYEVKAVEVTKNVASFNLGGLEMKISLDNIHQDCKICAYIQENTLLLWLIGKTGQTLLMSVPKEFIKPKEGSDLEIKFNTIREFRYSKWHFIWMLCGLIDRSVHSASDSNWRISNMGTRDIEIARGGDTTMVDSFNHFWFDCDDLRDTSMIFKKKEKYYRLSYNWIKGALKSSPSKVFMMTCLEMGHILKNSNSYVHPMIIKTGYSKMRTVKR